jgi:hypothetical protein
MNELIAVIDGNDLAVVHHRCVFVWFFILSVVNSWLVKFLITRATFLLIPQTVLLYRTIDLNTSTRKREVTKDSYDGNDFLSLNK